MKNIRKVLTSAAVFAIATVVLAACAGTRTIESFEVVGEAPEFENGVLHLQENATHELAGRVTFDNQTTDSVIGALITWESSNNDAVTVDNDGTVTAVSVIDSATITGTYRGEEDTITVIVSPLGDS